jgi:hypothetical protein
LTSGPPVLDDYLLPRRRQHHYHNSYRWNVCRGAAAAASHTVVADVFRNILPANEISIKHEPARATACALLNIKLQQLPAGRQDN